MAVAAHTCVLWRCSTGLLWHPRKVTQHMYELTFHKCNLKFVMWTEWAMGVMSLCRHRVAVDGTVLEKGHCTMRTEPRFLVDRTGFGWCHH